VSLQIVECVQGSDEWLRARMGLATASRFATVIAAAKDGKERKTRDKYMRQLAGEIITQEPAETFRNEAMERGKDQEPHLRAQYSFDTDNDVQTVGFLKDDEIGAGASPDGLIGKDGMVEFKSKLPDLLIELYAKKEYPPEHKAQLQGNLWIARREWIDIVCGFPKMPLFRQRVNRDGYYIKMLEIEVREFNEELARMVKLVRRML
jgi:hypothetical protein